MGLAVSVICIARTQKELDEKQLQLQSQTLESFEFVGEAGGTIPEAWNRALRRATGDILVFTETDAAPVTDGWLEELVGAVPDSSTIVKGLEIVNQPLDMANLACSRILLDGVEFDESFRWAEDSELFCRLEAAGATIVHAAVAPVVHLRKMEDKRLIRRAMRYGIYHTWLRRHYGKPKLASGSNDALKALAEAVLTLIGIVVGHISYPFKSWRQSGPGAAVS